MKNLALAVVILFIALTTKAQSGYSDCSNAHIICNKETFVVERLEGAGTLTSEIVATTCHEEIFPETNSIWLKWTIATGGTLGFTLLPVEEQDDLDFVLYHLPGGLDDCEDKQEMRCMASGKILGETSVFGTPCMGVTGLSNTAQDVSEGTGCKDGSDNFLTEIETNSQESYALFVNNFRSDKGFLLEFSGTCIFDKSLSSCDVSAIPVISNYGDNQLIVSQPSPNPAQDEARFTLQATVAMNGSIFLVDAQGHILQTSPISVLSGDNSYLLQVSQLSPGVYFVKMRFDDRIYLSRFYKG